MRTYIIVSQGQLIDTQYKPTLDGFAQKIADIEKSKGINIEQSQILERIQDHITIKKNILQRFLTEIVDPFLVNGFFNVSDLPQVYPPRSKSDEQDAIIYQNERIFRERTRSLLNIPVENLSDDAFDEIWCRMCCVEEKHAIRYRELLSHTDTIIHSGTNSIQAKYIARRLQTFNIEVPPERLFLSYVHGCEYKKSEEKQNLIHVIFGSLKLQKEDNVLLIQGSTDNIPANFLPVPADRYDVSAKTAVGAHASTIVVKWNNNACDTTGQCISLINYLQQSSLLSQPRSGVALNNK